MSDDPIGLEMTRKASEAERWHTLLSFLAKIERNTRIGGGVGLGFMWWQLILLALILWRVW